MNSELLSLSQLKMARDDEQEDSEETEWYDLLTEADLLVDDLDYEGFWGEDSEEVDSDLQGECTLQVIIANQYEHPFKVKTICMICGRTVLDFCDRRL